MALQESEGVARALCGTPYLIDGDPTALERFRKVLERSASTRVQAIATARKVANEASAIFDSFQAAVRSDLVAESNRLEGYNWTAPEVRTAVALHRELLESPIHHLLNALRDDERVMEALGLYRAHEIAEEWARTDTRPREYEIRQLHSIILASHHSAGRYKRAENEISGSAHRPVHPGLTPEHMAMLSQWWEHGTGDAVLDAAVVHAWLTHIHPFDDGNGRLARLLANLALVQQQYPPLLMRSEADRGQYLDALAASDDGDILPLYSLFVSVLRRSVRTMARPEYVQSVIEDRLLSTRSQRHSLWLDGMRSFEDELRRAFEQRGFGLLHQGVPDLSSFALLEDLDPDGNSWFAKVVQPSGEADWLLWFGFNSKEICQIAKAPLGYPSIYFAERSTDPSFVHPFKPRWRSGGSDVPTELVFTPGKRLPILMRWDWETQELSLRDAAEAISGVL